MLLEASMLACVPLAFTFGLDAYAVDWQVQWHWRFVIQQAHVQCLLRSTQGAEIQRSPVLPNHPKQALEEPSCQAKHHFKQGLQHQTSLNCRITEFLPPTALAAWWRCPNHLQIELDRQRSTLLQAVIIRQTILGLVLHRGPTAHLTKL